MNAPDRRWPAASVPARHFIGHRFVESADAATLPMFDPSMVPNLPQSPAAARRMSATGKIAADAPAAGFYVAPTLLGDVPAGHRLEAMGSEL